MQPLFAQLLLLVSKHIELVLASSAKPKAKQHPRVRVSLTWEIVEGAQNTDFGDNINRKIIKYMAACKSKLQSTPTMADVVGLPTDKGCGVGGQSLQTTLITLTDGYALLSPPMAPSCFCYVSELESE